MTDDAAVNYSVKELIGRLDGKLDTVLARLDSKADSAAQAKLEGRVAAVELEQAATRASSNTTRFIVFSAIPVVAGLAHFIR